jgi:hypothetical protein
MMKCPTGSTTSKTLPFPVPVYRSLSGHPIVLPIDAVCFLDLTPVKQVKSANYARFFMNYARK